MTIRSLEDLEALRETTDLECKAAQGRDGMGELPKSLWESYSAMANTAGGEIYLGIEETKDHRFVCRGIKEPDKVVKRFWDAIHSPNVRNIALLGADDVQVVLLEGVPVIRVAVPRAKRTQRPVYVGQNPLTGTFIRRHEGDYKADEEVVRRFMAEAIEESRDDGILEHFGLADLQSESVAAYRNRFAAQKPDSPWLDLDLPEFLKRIGAFRKDRATGQEGLTAAGLLMFGRYDTITEQFPNYMVDYQERPEPKRELRWIDRIIPDGTWSGNLFDFYQKTIKKLTADLKVPFALNGPTRIDDTPVHAALREALTNALIHADYTGRVSVLVVKRPDMFGFRNPGMMRVSVDQAMTGGISDCRNHRLQDMFRYIGLGDHAGSGVPSILKSWKSQHWRVPLLYDDAEYDQTLLELRTSSLVPEESIRELTGLFGERFSALPELSRLILTTAVTEGRVTHGRLKGLTAEHPKDVSAELAHLVRDGFLEKEGETRASVYFLSGKRDVGFTEGMDFTMGPLGSPSLTASSPDSTIGSPDLAGNSPDLAAILADTLRELGLDHMPGKMDTSKLRTVILTLCTGRWLNARQLAAVLQRDPKNLKIQHLSPMIAEGALVYRHPQSENHPSQAYRASEDQP